MSVVTGGMEYGKNDHSITPNDEENAIGETPGQDAPNFWALA